MANVRFKHILVPVDFGEVSARALDLAIALATPFEAKITLFHATWIGPTEAIAFSEGLYWPTEEYERQAKAAFDRLLAKTKVRYANVEAVVVLGEPREKIVECAERMGIDLIVMGTHGRRGLSRAFLGSVAERVVRSSPAPVLTVSLNAGQED
jgi:nucleotide-binding universal stress UspA family protein